MNIYQAVIREKGLGRRHTAKRCFSAIPAKDFGNWVVRKDENVQVSRAVDEWIYKESSQPTTEMGTGIPVAIVK